LTHISNYHTKSPRLLIILNRFVIGGQAVDTIPLAWFLKNDFDILILYGEKEKDEIEPSFLIEKYPGLVLKKIKYLRRSINPFSDLFAFFTVLFTILKYKPHIVHTHGAKSGFIGRITSFLSGVPVVVHTFHGHFFHSYFSRNISALIAFVERSVGKITTSAICLSPAQKQELVETYKILPASKVSIIPLGFAFDQQQSAGQCRQAFRNKYGLQPHDVAVGIVGRIVPVKNHAFFLQVAEQILAEATNTNVAFFVVGDGEVRDKVEALLTEKQIAFNNNRITAANRVVFTSWITDMYEVMNGLDIVALTSLNEGTPLSVIEAQYFKKPVVSTDAGGVRDTMIDNVTGFITNQDDLPAFKQKLQLLINNRELRETMGEAGCKFASEQFSKQNEIDRTKSFYFSLLAHKGLHFQ